MKPKKQFESVMNATSEEQIRELATLEYLTFLDARRTYNLPVNNSFELPTGNTLVFVDDKCCCVILRDEAHNELAIINLPETACGESKYLIELQAGLRYLRANGCEVIFAKYSKKE